MKCHNFLCWAHLKRNECYITTDRPKNCSCNKAFKRIIEVGASEAQEPNHAVGCAFSVEMEKAKNKDNNSEGQ